MTLLRTAMEGIVNSLQQASGVFASSEPQNAAATLPNSMSVTQYLASNACNSVVPFAQTSSSLPPASLNNLNLPTQPYAQSAPALPMRAVSLPMSVPQTFTVTATISAPSSSTVQQSSGAIDPSCQSISAAERTRIGMMALKISLEPFSPLKHVPLDWLDSFDAHCTNVSKAYNLNLEKLIIDNLYSLCPKEDKHWLIKQINNGRTFAWVELRQILLDHFSRRCNEMFKEVYMKEWDEPLTLVKFA